VRLPNSVADAPHNGRGHQPQPRTKSSSRSNSPLNRRNGKLFQCEIAPHPTTCNSAKHRIRRPHIGKRTATIIGIHNPRC